MRYYLRRLHVVLFTLILLPCVIFAAMKETVNTPFFRIQNELGDQDVSVFDDQNGNYYVFLPSYSDLEEVQIVFPYVFSFAHEFFLDDVRLYNKMTCERFELEKPYILSADGQNVATLWFYQSQNVATMFVETASGEMGYIHGDIDNQEFITMTLYTSDGTLNYHDKRSRLKGRGNSTWDADKHPYLLTLSSDGNLLNMGSANKWVLLANAYDETNLNNKLIYDLASQMDFAWSPDSQFVDLYLNGEYRGLYLLTEKIGICSNRLDIDPSSGEFLCMVNTNSASRLEKMDVYFESSMGRIIEVCFPNTLSDGDVGEISNLVYLMEKEFCSETDLGVSEIMDLDSWVRRYLIDEISGNIDSDLCSSYFYYSEGKFFAGPVWDYDMAFGNSFRNQEPSAFIAKNTYKRSTRSSLYYSALYNNESFYRRMIEIYNTEYIPLLQDMLQHGIDDQIELIQSASKMNSIRWRSMFDKWISVVPRNPDDVKDYIIRRMQFLNSAWMEDKDYCTVQLEDEPGGYYRNFSVEKGTCLETTYVDLTDCVWLDAKTGLPVDFQKPITADLIATPLVE